MTNGKRDTLALLRAVAEGSVTPEAAFLEFKESPFEDLGYAKVDHHRTIRQGAAEVIYGAGKTPEQILGISRAMSDRGCRNILVTRMSAEAAKLVGAQMELDYHELPRLGIVSPAERPSLGSIVVATGGTSDLPVAEEAALTAEVLGNLRVYQDAAGNVVADYGFGNDGDRTLSIVSLSGQKVYECPVDGANGTMTLPVDLGRGVYLYSVTEGGQLLSSHKFVVR